MSEHQMETRRRSRSKTPFLRSSCDHEACEHAGEEGHAHHHPKKKTAAAPSVQTIVEEKSHSPSKTKSLTTTTTTTSALTSSPKSKTSNPIERIKHDELPYKVSNSATSSSTTTTTTIITKRNIIDGISSSTPKAHYTMQESFASQFSTSGKELSGRGRERRQNEIKQNELNTQFERSQRESNTSKRSNSNSNISEILQNGDLSDHLAYQEYKNAGEYWNKTPKTDYTYSELSPHRRYLAPGVVAMPNMSRKSLNTHGDRIYHMIERNPAQEEYIIRRYASSQQQQQRYAGNEKAAERLLYDSGDELDYSKFENYAKNRHLNLHARENEQSWIMRLITSIWTSITGGAANESKLYRTNYYAQKRGFLGTIKHGIFSLWRYAYMFIASILYLDTWILQSNNADSRGRKRFFILLLLLLPLLLLGAWYLLDDSVRQYYLQRSESLLPISILAGFKGTFLTTGAVLQGMLLQIPLILSRAKDKLMPTNPTQEMNLQRTGLTAEEYQNILNHINSYVQKLLDVKMMQQQEEQKLKSQYMTTPQQMEIFEKLVRENIENVAREKRATAENALKLDDEELKLLAQHLQVHLESNNWIERPVGLSKQNLEEIKRLIAQHIEINNHKHYTLFAERIDIDALLDRISNLKVSQDDLIERLQQHELATDARFISILADIQEKLSALHEKQFTLLNKQIKLSLIEILGFKETAAGTKLDDVDLKSWVRNMFVAKDYLEERLQAINLKTNERIKDEIDRSGMVLFRDISERLKQEILIAVERKHAESSNTLKGEIHAALAEDEVRNIVKSVLAIYDADKTGLVDFALESAGGQILSTRCTENYHVKSAQISIFGIPLWYPSNTPRIAISPQVQPGECWAFQGFPGFLVLKLNSLVYVTGFTLEHIPRSLSPTGRIESAPRNFTVWGLEHEKDQDPVLFGEYEYSDNDASLQYFPVQNRSINRPYEIVELRIETNHGHPLYTCLYRFRVHGKPPTT